MEVNYSVPYSLDKVNPAEVWVWRLRSGGVQTGEDDLKPENGSLAKY